jgi:actin-related protein 8
MSATFGAGLSNACVVDVGAQTTTIACVDEGAIIPDSRINLKYGGDDITEYWTRLLLRSSFPWAEVDLAKSVDRRALQFAKERGCTLFESDVAMQVGETIVRNRGQRTRKFSWRVYEEIYLAPLALFLPSVMEKSEKMPTRHTVIPRSTDLYDGTFNDQEVCQY